MAEAPRDGLSWDEKGSLIESILRCRENEYAGLLQAT